MYKEIQIIIIVNKMTENESWYKRANLTLGMYGSLYGSLDKITGDSVFGIKRGKTKIAYNLLCDFMDKSEHMECFKIVPTGHIITTPPTQEEMILKFGIMENTGLDCAKWLVEYCLDNNTKLPDYIVHSANPAGKENIEKYLFNAKKHLYI